MATILCMSSNLQATIDRLSRLLGREDGALGDAARATGGVPVHMDLGGVLVIDRWEAVVSYDPDDGTIAPVSDARWRTLALVKAAEKFPDLRELAPGPPSNAVVCGTCEGSGVLMGDVNCGVCLARGWLVTE